jgi:hypothetical protein
VESNKISCPDMTAIHTPQAVPDIMIEALETLLARRGDQQRGVSTTPMPKVSWTDE